MESFWGSDVWGSVNLIGILLLTLLIANALKKSIKLLSSYEVLLHKLIFTQSFALLFTFFAFFSIIIKKEELT